MSSTNSRYLAVASGHIDSLINYVLDVKPYHVKLSEIVEQYLFNDSINAKITDNNQVLAFLGADIMPSTSTNGIRAKRSSSWSKTLTSDGSRTTWSVPWLSLPKLASHASQAGVGFNIDLSKKQNPFIKGRDDDLQISGISNVTGNGVFNQKRWDGPSIPNVYKNGEPQQESFDYFLSYGAFSFTSRTGQTWKELNLSVNENDPKLLASYKAKFPVKIGELKYNDVNMSFGTISDIQNGNYDEWTLTCIDDFIELKVKRSAILAISSSNVILTGPQNVSGVNVSAGDIVLIKNQTTVSENSLYQVTNANWTRISATNYESILGNNVGLESAQETEPYIWVTTGTNPGLISVEGKYSGIVGSCFPGNTFSHSLISFIYEGNQNEVISPGEYFTLTPNSKITIAADALEEDWSLIKTNPIALSSKPKLSYSNIGNRTILPHITIHTISLDNVNENVYWSITFDNGTFTITRARDVSLTDIIGTESFSLTDNLSIKTDYIHLTISLGDGVDNNDEITFSTKSSADNILVYGSLSGWQENAKFGEWYWNGKVGFKVPKLAYVSKLSNSTISTSTSADNNSWITTISNNQIVRKINFENGKFYIAGDNSIAGSSVDGKTWTGGNEGLFTPSPSFPDRRLIVLGEQGKIYTTLDGENWLNKPTNTTQHLRACTQIPNLLYVEGSTSTSTPTINCIIVIGDNGTILTSTSTNSWVSRDSGVSVNLNAIAWSSSGLEITSSALDLLDKPIIIVGDNGTILRSTNRVDWVLLQPVTNENLNAVIYEPSLDLFVAVGNGGTILTSSDAGLTWMNLSVFSAGQFSDIVFGDNKFVAVSIDGMTVSSYNGVSWIGYVGKAFNSIAYGNGVWVGVGGRVNSTAQFVELAPVSSIAEPSEYTITFIDDKTATVSNNLYGYRNGLEIDKDWTDGYASFRIDTSLTEEKYQFGDQVKVFLVPKYIHYAADSTNAHYDESNYQSLKYESYSERYEYAQLYNEEYFPFYHSHGSVIFRDVVRPTTLDRFNNVVINSSSGVIDNDEIIIDKAYVEKVRLKIINGGVAYPELGAVNDWLPLEFRVNSVFPELVTKIDAYLGSNPNRKVFTIEQPRYQNTNINASGTLTFATDFVADYLKFNTQFSILFLPDESYGQTIRVKITENLTTYAKVRFDFNDIVKVNIDDVQFIKIPINNFDLTESLDVHFIEGGALPFAPFGYDMFPFDCDTYASRFTNGFVSRMIESPVGSGNYEWTDNPTDWISPNRTSEPSIFIDTTQDEGTVGSSFDEGFSIREIEVEQNNSGYGIYPYDNENYPYDVELNFPSERLSLIFNSTKHPNGMIVTEASPEYLITVLNKTYTGSPTIVIESLTDSQTESPIPNMFPFPQLINVTSENSFSFVTSIQVPFRLLLE